MHVNYMRCQSMFNAYSDFIHFSFQNAQLLGTVVVLNMTLQLLSMVLKQAYL